MEDGASLKLCHGPGLFFLLQHSLPPACKSLLTQRCQPEGQMAQLGPAHSSETRQPGLSSLRQPWAAHFLSSAFGDTWRLRSESVGLMEQLPLSSLWGLHRQDCALKRLDFRAGLTPKEPKLKIAYTNKQRDKQVKKEKDPGALCQVPG